MKAKMTKEITNATTIFETFFKLFMVANFQAIVVLTNEIAQEIIPKICVGSL